MDVYLCTNIDIEDIQTFRESERYEVAFGNDDSICSKGNMGSMVHTDLVMSVMSIIMPIFLRIRYILPKT